MKKDKIKVLIVDDSVLIRKYLSDIISEDPELELLGTAYNGESAIKKAKRLKPDVITLDLVMPGIDGIATLKSIMEENPTRVIMISSATKENEFATLLALELGAIDFINKPSGTADNIKKLKNDIINKIKMAMNIKLKSIKKTEKNKEKKIKLDEAKAQYKNKIQPGLVKDKSHIIKEKHKLKNISTRTVAIGCSTGGPSALKDIFINPSINTSISYVIVQHMPENFTKLFAERLNDLSIINIKEAEDGDMLYEGFAYLAPGHSHMTIVNKGGVPFIKLVKSDRVSGHMPSIDVMFDSISNNNMAKNTIAIIMTGMGRDGADGIVNIKKHGGITLAQDENTSIVFGMNREAINTGYIDKVLPLDKIVDNINTILAKSIKN